MYVFTYIFVYLRSRHPHSFPPFWDRHSPVEHEFYFGTITGRIGHESLCIFAANTK